MNARNFGHQHAEAFCHMLYMGSNNTGRIVLIIYNSRDGVTPFMTFSKEYGIQLQHVNFEQDWYDPAYKPKKGDLIWRDWTPEEAKVHAENYFDRLLLAHEQWQLLPDEEKEKRPNDLSRYFQRHKEAGKEAWVKTFLDSLQPGEPHLELVKEDWK